MKMDVLWNQARFGPHDCHITGTDWWPKTAWKNDIITSQGYDWLIGGNKLKLHCENKAETEHSYNSSTSKSFHVISLS